MRLIKLMFTCVMRNVSQLASLTLEIYIFFKLSSLTRQALNDLFSSIKVDTFEYSVYLV